MSARPPRTGQQVHDATGRIELRRRHERLRRVRVIAIILGALVLVAVGGWIIGFSPAMAVKTVDVSGTELLHSDDVRKRAEVAVGTPLVWCDPQPIAARVAAIPEVKSVTVSQSWPDTITIAVTEREAVFAVRSSVEGEFWLVDDEGIVYHTVATVPDGLLVATSSSTTIPVLKDAATVVTSLPSAVRKNVASLTVSSADNIVLNLTNKSQVIWGSAAESTLKGQVVEALLKVDAKVYDVSSPTHPVKR